ncbi:NAD(P)H-dependent oxidoreductase [Zunongwangia sp.]|uniref:NAD(P)H-dependent oxidoreductase n=1 Tax=Zunongwangia sp. TaxID=1965325 RepID=UPI003AA7CB5A
MSIKALEWRYAVKKFDENKTISEAKIAILKKSFNLTATSYGLQPIRLVVVKNKPVQEKLREYSMNQPQLDSASHVLILCIEKNINKEFIANYFERVKKIRETPDEILDPFKNFLMKDFEKKSDEEIRNWAKNQAYLALGNLLTVCAVESIDACPMEGFVPEKVDALLELDKLNLESVLVLPVGIRAKDDIFSEFKKVRRSEEDSIISIY